MNIFREGKLRDSDISTGNVLSVELYETDHNMLVGHRFTVSRFCEFRHQQLGWDGMDKARIDLKKPVNTPEDDDKLVSLTLDGGGDLYFTIWESERLRMVDQCQVFNTSEIVGHDPNNKLQRLGIEVVRFYGLLGLATELYVPKFRLPPSTAV